MQCYTKQKDANGKINGRLFVKWHIQAMPTWMGLVSMLQAIISSSGLCFVSFVLPWFGVVVGLHPLGFLWGSMVKWCHLGLPWREVVVQLCS